MTMRLYSAPSLPVLVAGHSMKARSMAGWQWPHVPSCGRNPWVRKIQEETPEPSWFFCQTENSHCTKSIANCIKCNHSAFQRTMVLLFLLVNLLCTCRKHKVYLRIFATVTMNGRETFVQLCLVCLRWCKITKLAYPMPRHLPTFYDLGLDSNKRSQI